MRRFAAAFLVFIAVYSATTLAASAVGTEADKLCLDPVPNQQEYRSDKPWGKVFTEKRNGKTIEIFNLFGTNCADKTSGEVTSGHCIAPQKCLATKTDGAAPDQEKPGEYCASHPDICAGVGADTVPEPTTQPQPNGGSTPNVPQPNSGPQPNQDPNTRVDDAFNALNPKPSTQTNSFGDQLQQAERSNTGLFNTIQNYFKPQDALSPDSTGIGNTFGVQSQTFSPSGESSLGGGLNGSLAEQAYLDSAFSPTNGSTGFENTTPIPNADDAANTPWWQSPTTFSGFDAPAGAEAPVTSQLSGDLQAGPTVDTTALSKAQSDLAAAQIWQDRVIQSSANANIGEESGDRAMFLQNDAANRVADAQSRLDAIMRGETPSATTRESPTSGLTPEQVQLAVADQFAQKYTGSLPVAARAAELANDPNTRSFGGITDEALQQAIERPNSIGKQLDDYIEKGGSPELQKAMDAARQGQGTLSSFFRSEQEQWGAEAKSFWDAAPKTNIDTVGEAARATVNLGGYAVAGTGQGISGGLALVSEKLLGSNPAPTQSIGDAIDPTGAAVRNTVDALNVAPFAYSGTRSAIESGLDSLARDSVGSVTRSAIPDAPLAIEGPRSSTLDFSYNPKTGAYELPTGDGFGPAPRSTDVTVTPSEYTSTGGRFPDTTDITPSGSADAALTPRVDSPSIAPDSIPTSPGETLHAYTPTETQMTELTRPLVAQDTPITPVERTAIDNYNAAVTRYTDTQQLIADGRVTETAPIAREAFSDYVSAGTELRNAGLIERPGAITDTQFGLDNVYRAETGEVLASRANSFQTPEPYQVAGSRIPDAPTIADFQPTAPRTDAFVAQTEPQSFFDRVAQPVRDFFSPERAPETPSFDQRGTFTQTIERDLGFKLAEPEPIAPLNVAEARALQTYNSAMAERSLPIPSEASAAGARLVAEQRADFINRAMADLRDAGLRMRADGPIVREAGEIVAAPLPIQIPGLAPYGITAPIDTSVRDAALSQNAQAPSVAEPTASPAIPVSQNAPTESITAGIPERGLLPSETASPAATLQKALVSPFALGLFAALLNPTFAEAGKTNGSPSFSTCVAQMCLRPVTGNFSYYDPRKGGMNVDWSAVRNGFALTKSGEAVSMNRNTNIDEHFTIASQRYPVNTIVRLCNGALCTYVRVNDTGDFEKYGRVGDLMPGPARAIQFDIEKGVNQLTQTPVIAFSGERGNHQLPVNVIADGVMRELNAGTPLTQALDHAAARSRSTFTYTIPASNNIAYVATPGSVPGTQLAAIQGEPTAQPSVPVSQNAPDIAAQTPRPNAPAPDFETRLRDAYEKQNAELAAQNANKPALSTTEELEKRLQEKAEKEIAQAGAEARSATRAEAPVPVWTPLSFKPAPITQPYIASAPLVIDIPFIEPAPVDVSDVAPSGGAVLNQPIDPVQDVTPQVPTDVAHAQPDLVAGAVDVPANNATDPALLQKRLEETRASVAESQKQVDDIKNKLSPVSQKVTEIKKQQTAVAQAKGNRTTAVAGLQTLESLWSQPSPAQISTMRNGTAAAARLAGNVQQLGDSGLASEMRGYVNLLNSMAKPENQTLGNKNLAVSKGQSLLARASTVISGAEQKAASLGNLSELQKTQTSLSSELSVANKTLDTYKSIEQTTLAQLNRQPAIAVAKTAPATVPVAQQAPDVALEPAEITVPEIEQAPVDLSDIRIATIETPPFMRAPEAEQTLTLPPKFSPEFTMYPYDLVGNPPAYTYVQPIVIKQLIFQALGLRTYLPASMMAELNDVTLETPTLTFTKQELDAIQWGRMDKYAYESLLGILNPDPTRMTGYVPPVPNGNIQPGSQILADIATNPTKIVISKPDASPTELAAAEPTAQPAIPVSQNAPETTVTNPTPNVPPNQNSGSQSPTAIRPDAPQETNPVPSNTAGELPPPETSAQTRPGDFSVTEIMPDGSIRTLQGDVTVPGSNVPANRGGGGGIVPPADSTWRVYGNDPVPGPWLGGRSGGLPWWTIGGAGGIAATLTGIAALQSDEDTNDRSGQSQAEPTAQPSTPVSQNAPDVRAPNTDDTDESTPQLPCSVRTITRDNMLRMLLGDLLSEVDCVPTPQNILNNEPVPTIPDLQPVPETRPGAQQPITPPGTPQTPGTVLPRPDATVPPGSAPTGVSGVSTGGTNSQGSSRIMSFLSGLLKGFTGALQQRQLQQQLQQSTTPTPNPILNTTPQPRGTTTPISVQITANPNPARAGEQVRVSWASISATMCRAFDPTGVQIATGTPDGAVMFAAPHATSAYRVTCTNPAGQTATSSVTLLVR